MIQKQIEATTFHFVIGYFQYSQVAFHFDINFQMKQFVLN